MPFLLAEILDFQGSAHLIGVGSLSYLLCVTVHFVLYYPHLLHALIPETEDAFTSLTDLFKPLHDSRL